MASCRFDLANQLASYYDSAKMQEPEASDGIAERVIATIARTQRLAPETVTPDKTFEELKIDSLDGINIVFELEKEFDVDVPDEGISDLKSVADTIAGIEKLLAQKGRIAETAARGE